MNYKDIADALEAAATYVDGVEHTKVAAESAARETRIAKFAASFEARTGEPISDKVREKLATLDVDTLDQMLKVAHNSGDSPESLGAPADITDDAPAPKTVKEAAARADDAFLSWVVSD
jgi:hypothetical protein